MAAASHSQLCVIGYGGNQQWDQAALGNRGEALCYDMGHVLTDNDFTDSRPFWVINPDNQRNWGVNAGGGSILHYVDATWVTLGKLVRDQPLEIETKDSRKVW